MFEQIASSVRAVVLAEPGLDAEVRFDPPGPSWSDVDGRPWLSLFLHEVREELGGRTVIWSDQRDEDGRVVARCPPPRHFRLGYLVTAWSSTVDAELALLGAALDTFARVDVVPPDCLTPPLRAAGLPVTIAVAHPDLVTAGAGLWQALGIPPRTALDLVITAPLVRRPVTDLVTAPTEVVLGVDTAGPAAPARESAQAAPRKQIREGV